MVEPTSDPRENSATPWRILEAVGYLNQCRTGRRGIALLTAEDPAEIRLVLKRFLAGLDPAARIARLLAPTDSRHAFLEAILVQLGFEPFESSADDLQRLLNVVLRQGVAQNVTTVLIVEDAHQFGPRVMEVIRELVRSLQDLRPPPLVVLAGTRDLNRVLDSKGMASIAALTARRFDLAAGAGAAAAPPSAAPPVGEPCLVLSLDDAELERFPLGPARQLIGRGPHCDIALASRFVSRQHALFLRNDSGDWIIDLKSTNGTSVNSTLVRQRRLAHGDVIAIGNHRLRYHNPAAAVPAPLPEPRADQLGETTVMRSLRAVIDPDSAASPAA